MKTSKFEVTISGKDEDSYTCEDIKRTLEIELVFYGEVEVKEIK